MRRVMVPEYHSVVTSNRAFTRPIRATVDLPVALAKWDWLSAFNTKGRRILRVTETIDGLDVTFAEPTGYVRTVNANSR